MHLSQSAQRELEKANLKLIIIKLFLFNKKKRSKHHNGYYFTQQSILFLHMTSLSCKKKELFKMNTLYYPYTHLIFPKRKSTYQWLSRSLFERPSEQIVDVERLREMGIWIRAGCAAFYAHNLPFRSLKVKLILK